MQREDFLKQKIQECGYNLKEFATYIDMPYSTLLSIVNKSVGGAALDNIIKICNGLNISIERLNPYIERIQNNEIEKKYGMLNPLGKKKADGYIEDLLENSKYTEQNGTKNTISDDIGNEIKKATLHPINTK